MNRLILLVLGLVVVGGGAFYVTNLIAENARLQSENASLRGGGQTASRPSAPAPPRAATSGPTRTLSAGDRQAMLDTLREESGDVKKVWLRVDPSDAEAAGFAKAIADTFKEAGWDVTQMDTDGLMLRPGVIILVGDEEWPSYAETADKALKAAGVSVTEGLGYRSYYEEQVKTKPNWRGTKFLPDQSYVVLVGRKPEPKPES